MSIIGKEWWSLAEEKQVASLRRLGLTHLVFFHVVDKKFECNFHFSNSIQLCYSFVSQHASKIAFFAPYEQSIFPILFQ